MNTQLFDILNSSRPPHAVMLTGADDKTRKKEALNAAAAFVCESADNKPCGKCAACKKAKAGSHPDILTVVPTGKGGNYKKEDITTAISDNLYVAPNEAERKVYVLYDADKLTAIIQNTLLKSIEEPPGFAGFIFTCRSKESILETVRSRVTEVRLGEAESEFVQADEDTRSLVLALASAISTRDEYSILKACSGIKKSRQYIADVCSLLIIVLRDALAEGEAKSMSGADKQAVTLAAKCTQAELLAAVAAAKSIIRASESNANENLMLTRLSTGLAGALCR